LPKYILTVGTQSHRLKSRELPKRVTDLPDFCGVKNAQIFKQFTIRVVFLSPSFRLAAFYQNSKTDLLSTDDFSFHPVRIFREDTFCCDTGHYNSAVVKLWSSAVAWGSAWRSTNDYNVTTISVLSLSSYLLLL